LHEIRIYNTDPWLITETELDKRAEMFL
jgi:hypothetical protein